MQLIHYSGPVPNFGDDLNALVWPALAPHLFEEEDDERGFVGIGTILGIAGHTHRKLEVMSSGAGYDPIGNWADRHISFHCVRGPVTTHVLGLDPSVAITDGAILCPLVPALQKRRGDGRSIAVVPHFQTLAFPGWKEACDAAGMVLIDPRQPPETVIQAIADANLVLTESLHGAIIADTYGIPWSAFATSGNFCMPKWIDWTASVGVEFGVTYVPPPNGDPLEIFGRPRRQFGSRVSFSLEHACAEMQAHVRSHAPKIGFGRVTHWAKAGAKALGLQHLSRAYSGLSSSRTAEALYRLGQSEGTVSQASHRDRLTDRLASALHAIA